jgi:hypothetical protein
MIPIAWKARLNTGIKGLNRRDCGFGTRVSRNNGKKNIGFLSEESRRRSQNAFSYFTSDQARAVYEWLLYAQDWEEWCYDSDRLEGALEYWKKRAEQ